MKTEINRSGKRLKYLRGLKENQQKMNWKMEQIKKTRRKSEKKKLESGKDKENVKKVRKK